MKNNSSFIIIALVAVAIFAISSFNNGLLNNNRALAEVNREMPDGGFVEQNQEKNNPSDLFYKYTYTDILNIVKLERKENVERYLVFYNGTVIETTPEATAHNIKVNDTYPIAEEPSCLMSIITVDKESETYTTEGKSVVKLNEVNKITKQFTSEFKKTGVIALFNRQNRIKK